MAHAHLFGIFRFSFVNAEMTHMLIGLESVLIEFDKRIIIYFGDLMIRIQVFWAR